MDAFSALSDPTRRRIVELVAARPLSSGEIAQRFEISASAVSQHLKILRAANVVRARVQAQRRIYELDASGIDEVGSWLDRIRRFWGDRLTALEAELRKEER